MKRIIPLVFIISIVAIAFAFASCSCGPNQGAVGQTQGADARTAAGSASSDHSAGAPGSGSSAGDAQGSDASAAAGASSGAATGDAAGSGTAATGTAAKPSATTSAAKTPKPASAQATIAMPGAPTVTATAHLSTKPIAVELDVAEAGLQVRYTLDGSAPSASKGTVYSKPFDVASTQTLKCVAIRTADGKVSPVTEDRFTVGELFVAPGAAGDGRKNAPLGKIAAALELASAQGYPIVKVASGTYQEQVTVKAAINLAGGYGPDFSSRDAAGNPSVVQAPADIPSTVTKPSSAIRFEGKLPRSSVIEGFSFKGGEAGYTAGAVFDGGASPTLRRCAMQGGFGSYAYGARALGGAAPLIQYCRLAGGEGGTTAAFSCDKASPEISSCTLTGGDGTQFSYGATGINSGFTVSSSVIVAGSSATSYGVACYSGADAKILGCTVVAGKALQSYGIFIADAKPTIVDCIVTANGKEKSYGIYENYGASDPVAVENCCVFGCANGLYYDDDLKAAFTAVDDSGNFASGAKVLASPAAKGCVAVDPVLSGSMRLGKSSPAAVTAGGKESGAAVDVDGKARTAPWSIGANEVD